MIRRWIQKKFHLEGNISESLGSFELFEYIITRGLKAFLRGLVVRLRFKKAGKPIYIGKNCRLFFLRHIETGNDFYLADGCYLNGASKNGLRFGSRVRIHVNSWVFATSRLDQLGEGITTGDDIYIGPNCYIGAGGGITLGSHVMIGANVQILAENHVFDDLALPIYHQGVTRQGIRIGSDVWIGNNAVILDGVEIGDGCVIGAGAVVTRSLPAGVVAAGNPARVLRKRGSR